MLNRQMPLVVACAAAAAAALSATAGPQAGGSAAQPQMFRMNVVSVAPGMMQDYVAFQTNEVMPALKKGGAPAREAFSSGAFGEPGVFAFFTPVADMAQFDGEGPLVKALGQDGAREQGSKGAKMTSSSRALLVRTRPDLSYLPNPGARPALAMISEVAVAAGRRADFEAIVKRDVLPAMKKADVKSYHVFEVLYGADANTFYTAVGYDSYAAIGKGHPFQVALGDDGARKLEAKVAGIVTRVERTIVRYRADLSFNVKAGTN